MTAQPSPTILRASYTSTCLRGLRQVGGLGVHCVKTRAMAMLIHTFLAQAISPRFSNNQYHKYLFKWHVLEEYDFPNPGHPPYYSTAFFNLIKDVRENTPLNLAWVTVKQWCQLLLERGITHTSDDHDVPPVLLKSRLEENNQHLDFSEPYRLSRKFGLAPEQKSFIFKMMQSLLPTRDRLARMGKIQSRNCQHFDEVTDSTVHLLTCSHSSEDSNRLQKTPTGLPPPKHLPIRHSFPELNLWSYQ